MPNKNRTISGITFEPKSLMFDPVERQKLPVSNIINDMMHVYLCNGCASWEVALMMEAITEHTALTRELLKETVVAAGWPGTRSSGKIDPITCRIFFMSDFLETDCIKGWHTRLQA